MVYKVSMVKLLFVVYSFVRCWEQRQLQILRDTPRHTKTSIPCLQNTTDNDDAMAEMAATASGVGSRGNRMG